MTGERRDYSGTGYLVVGMNARDSAGEDGEEADADDHDDAGAGLSAAGAGGMSPYPTVAMVASAQYRALP